MTDIFEPWYLPNGLRVCFLHSVVVCYACCVNYTSENSKYLGFPSDPKPSRGTGHILARRYEVMPGTVPALLFPPIMDSRFFYRYDTQNEVLVYTDGSCRYNGTKLARAGCAFVYGPPTSYYERNYASFALEMCGPFGDECITAISERAELRAVIGALRYFDWASENIQSLVVACDAQYVVDGATVHARRWIMRDWMTLYLPRRPIAHRDLWECLLGEIEKLAAKGVVVSFWWIPREWNTEADYWAKMAADVDVPPYHFTDPPKLGLVYL